MPIAAPIAGVPASKRCGARAYSVRAKVTRRIISPPPRNGGSSASSSPAHPERAAAGRAEHLVAGEGVGVDAQRRHVERPVRRPLGAVDQHPGADRPRRGDDARRDR